MKLPKTPLYPITFCFTLGTLMAPSLPHSASSWMGCFGGLMLLSFLVISIQKLHFKNYKTIFLYGLFIPLGVVVYKNYYEWSPEHFQNRAASFKEGFKVLEILEDVNENDFSNTYFGKMIQLDSTPAIGKVLVHQAKDSLTTRLLPGNLIYTQQLLEDLQPPKNPGSFNYKRYLENLGISAQIDLKSNYYRVVQTQQKTLAQKIKTHHGKVKHQLLQSPLSAASKALVIALVLGNRDALSEALLVSYQKAGMMHLLAVSGLHIGILTGFLLLLFQPLFPKRWKGVRNMVVALCLWLYAFWVGMHPSVVRAVTMFTALLLGQLRGNSRSSSLHVLVLSFLVLLICHPPYLRQLGFQMSYLAVFGILLLHPQLQGFWKPKNIILKRFWEITTISLAAQALVAPLSIYYFHQFPGLFLISNWIILPFFSLFLGACFLITLWIQGFDLPEEWASGFDQIVALINKTVGWIAQQEGFIWKQLHLSLPLLLLLYVLLLVVILGLHYRNRQSLLALCCSVLLLLGYYGYEKEVWLGKEDFWILHQSRSSLLVFKEGDRLHYWSSEKRPDSLAGFQDFINNSFPLKQIPHDLNNFIGIKNIRLLIIDSDSFFEITDFQPTHILIRNQARINMDRLLTYYRPQMIIADGSNPPWEVARWKTDCEKHKLRFHSTQSLGALQITP